MSISRCAAGAVVVGSMVLGADIASGQDYPNKPIHIITNAAGGGADVLARIIAQGISGPLGQPVVVDNRGSFVATMGAISSAPPDGHSMVITGAPAWVLPLFEKTPWDMANFAPITVTSRETLVAAVHPSLPVKSIKELIALAKAKPGELNYAAAGLSGRSGLAVELFKSMAGVNIMYVPYNGTAAVATAVVSGEVQMVIMEASLVMPQVKAGRLRALAVTSAQPSVLAPDLPPIAATLTGYEWIGMTAMFIPVKTPGPIINRLNREIVRVLTMPDIKQQSLLRGVEIVASSPEQAAVAIKSELAKTVKVIKDAGIKVQR